ncbi:hypothetical protein V9T40_014156 [Parthenolecanium corni]|uniref:Uncharacterized protein n=1 Tax=Parthenolecanium corni TaxID=536013 RepID=A0AAN9TC65_9HEMI
MPCHHMYAFEQAIGAKAVNLSSECIECIECIGCIGAPSIRDIVYLLVRLSAAAYPILAVPCAAVDRPCFAPQCKL